MLSWFQSLSFAIDMQSSSSSIFGYKVSNYLLYNIVHIYQMIELRLSGLHYYLTEIVLLCYITIKRAGLLFL